MKDIGSTIFYRGSQIQIITDTNEPQELLTPIQRVCCLRSRWLLLLTQNNKLYEGHFDERKLCILLRYQRCDIKDVQFCKNLSRVYVITNTGEALFQNLTENATQLNKQWSKIIFDPLELCEIGILISRVACSFGGVLFITQNNEVYALGDCGNLQSIDYEQPKRIRMIKSSESIIDIAAGDDFFVILTTKYANHSVNYSMNQENDEFSLNHMNIGLKAIQNIIDFGASILHTAIYTLGSSNGGRLGTGDFMKRDNAFHIEKLNDIGICSISTGCEHSISLTLDGRLFQWGLNDRHQLIDCNDTVLSSPKELNESSHKNIWCACCDDYSIIVLNSKGELFENGTLIHKQENINDKLHMRDFNKTYPFVLSCGQLIILNPCHFKIVYQPVYNHLQHQTRTLFNLFKIFQQLNKFLQKVYSELQPICHHLQTTIYILVAILHNFHEYYCGNISNPQELIFIKSHNECIEIFTAYTRAYCDTYSVNGFKGTERMLSPKLEPGENSKYKDFIKMFQQPFQIFPYIIQILDQLTRIDGIIDNDYLIVWENFIRQTRIELELAENTLEFWNNNALNVKLHQFKKRNRRVILTSTAIPLKLSHPISLTTPMIILFSDCLAQVSNYINIFPLVAVWLKREDNGIRVITPEKNFALTARNKHDENLWYDQLESSIKTALKLDANVVKLPEMRYIEYSFNGHSSRNINVKGTFSNGIMHGKCYLEYPDGKLYAGEIVHGEIEGYGYMYIPNTGFYRGEFHLGKFWGYGKLIINETDMYEGHFRNDVFHGHGYLRQKDIIYVGEFQDNQKCGYGVLENSVTGYKYMGLFMDNKRVGNGICITSNGDYFEGTFVNDELTGKGCALFQNNAYYEGELTINGPYGMGKYYMPNAASEKQESLLAVECNDESENGHVEGRLLSGHLMGDWNKVTIKLGTMEMHCAIPKHPRNLGTYIISNEKKWFSLFSNFESELFGDLSKTVRPNKALTYALWNRVLAFIARQQELYNNKFLSEELDIFHKVYQKSKNTKQYLDNVPLNADKFSLNETLSVHKFESPRLSRSQTSLDRVDSSTNVSINTFHILSKMENSSPMENNTYLDTYESSISINDAGTRSVDLHAQMIVIPQFGMSDLNSADLQAIKEYLTNAFNYRYHPLYHLNQRIVNCFYRSYGCWKGKSTYILAKSAMIEWEYLSQKIYEIVRKLFPALPEEFCLLTDNKNEIVSHITILYPILLTESIYSTLFVFYANKYSNKDEMYRLNLLQADKLSNAALIKALQLQDDMMPVINSQEFQQAIQLLKQLKEKFNPTAILCIIENCVQYITKAYHSVLHESDTALNADIVMPLALFLLLRAAVPHLGAEFALLDDLTDTKNFQFEMNGIRGYCYATLKASYEHIATKLLFNQK